VLVAVWPRAENPAAVTNEIKTICFLELVMAFLSVGFHQSDHIKMEGQNFRVVARIGGADG
jgi:hypothetical protein